MVLFIQSREGPATRANSASGSTQSRSNAMTGVAIETLDMISLLSNKKPRLLIVDDESANVALLKRVLAGPQLDSISSTCDPTKAVEMFLSVRPDLLLLDLQMPVMDGFAVLAAFMAAVGAE